MAYRFRPGAIRGLAGLAVAAVAGATSCGANVMFTDERQACVEDGATWDGAKCVEAPPPVATPDRCYETCEAEPTFHCIDTCKTDAGDKVSATPPTCIGNAWV